MAAEPAVIEEAEADEESAQEKSSVSLSSSMK